jgi:hypothetical protein
VSAGKLIRWLTFGVVLAVAAFAAVVSYSHVYDLGRLHGQSGTAARLLPLSVDGLILAASLVLLQSARSGRSAPRLARAMLALGVGATVAANAAYGAAWGTLGILISAWPAASFIGAAEMLFVMIRRTAEPVSDPAEVTGPAQADQAAAQVAQDAEQAARHALAATVAAGNPLSQRQVMARFGLNRAQVAQVFSDVIPANGHKADSDAALAEVAGAR